MALNQTGITTAAIVDLIHNVTVMLETNTYVRCLLKRFGQRRRRNYC